MSLSQRSVGLKYGFRSGLEEAIANQLKGLGVKFGYETLVIPFTRLDECRYTPDYILPNGIIVESKGRFLTADRKKHKLVKKQHPNLDVRLVFSTSKQAISKKSRTTYAAWSQTFGFQFADKLIPLAWILESPNKQSLAAIKRIMEG